MKTFFVIYDDTKETCYDIKNVIGEKRFGEVVYKRKTLQERFEKCCKDAGYQNRLLLFLKMDEVKSLMANVEELPENSVIVHVDSSFVVTDEKKFKVILEKAVYAKETIAVKREGKTFALIFANTKDYLNYLKQVASIKNQTVVEENLEYQILNIDCVCNMNDLSEFLQYITGGFDARFFNSLQGDQYTVTKSSTNKKKIKSEYMYYHLLPDEMKRWFVLPYNYSETEKTASYTMERLHMTDIAIRWVHGAFTKEEFEDLMKKVFYFVTTRKEKTISREAYEEEAETLYHKKVIDRVEELKAHELFPVLASYIQNGTKYDSIDEIIQKYLYLFESIKKELYRNPIAVIGHGDLCFSNMLYNKETQTLKLIDVKGAQKEEELWTNPYYDLAKLSHSICGRYDFFNNDIYEIRMDDELHLNLVLEFDNKEFVEIFKKYLEQNGYNYRMIRILETSLFLSMLPLHMDKPKKVFGFLQNAMNIMESL